MSLVVYAVVAVAFYVAGIYSHKWAAAEVAKVEASASAAVGDIRKKV